jgi:hypothetical protein
VISLSFEAHSDFREKDADRFRASASVPMGDRRIVDGYSWDSFFPNSRTFLCRSERFFITAVFLI